MIDILLKLLLLIACSTILLRCEPAINRMSPCTPWPIRYALLLIALGALLGIFGLLDGGSTNFATVILASGIAILLMGERRLRHLFNHRKQGDRHA